MSNTNAVVVICGYWGESLDWERVVIANLMLGLQEADRREEAGNVKLLIGTGELERAFSPPISIQLIKHILQKGPATLGTERLQVLLQYAEVMTTTMTTAEEMERAALLCAQTGASELYVVHRPEHVRAVVTARAAITKQELDVRVYGLASPEDFEGVTDPLCVEGVHMDDPKRDPYAIFADPSLRKKAAATVFGAQTPGALIDLLTDLNKARTANGMAPLDLTQK